jgi:4-amino-4-deoxy-L-arabinose transferase-like glycosyltransferase
MSESAHHSSPERRGDVKVLAGIAALKILIHLPVLSRYGYHNDELYFIACGNHLSFGYVDHAPMVPWIARVATTLFGESLHGLRLFSVLAGAATIFLTGLLARRLGGGRFAQVVAALAVLIAPVYLRTGNLLAIPSFEPLYWVVCATLLVRIIQEGNARLWPWLGLVAGLGLLNKHSMLFFGLGLVVALLLTPLRAHFRSLWLYAGGGIAVALFLPNLIWQAMHGWPTFYFLLGLNERVMSGISAPQFVAGQLLYLHPLNAVVWLTGLGWLFFGKSGRRYRALGWIWVSVFVLLLLTRSKIYYLAPAYPALLAGGAVAIEGFLATRQRWLRPALVGLLILGGLAMAPASVPAMPIDATDRYVDVVTLGAFENIHELTGDLHAMFGWRERVEVVADVWHGLPESVKDGAVLWAAGYGNAGAIDHLGVAHGLPAAVSLALTYQLWGLPDRPIDTVISVGYSIETLERIFDEVEELARVELEDVNPWDREFVVALCRGPKAPLPDIWARNRPW